MGFGCKWSLQGPQREARLCQRVLDLEPGSENFAGASEGGLGVGIIPLCRLLSKKSLVEKVWWTDRLQDARGLRISIFPPISRFFSHSS